MKINHTQFFNRYREAYGKLSQKTVTGIELLGRQMESDPEIKDLRWPPTCWQRSSMNAPTPGRRSPSAEPGILLEVRARNEHRQAVGQHADRRRLEISRRGYVQITGRDNYRELSALLEIPSRRTWSSIPTTRSSRPSRIRSCRMACATERSLQEAERRHLGRDVRL